MEPLNDWFTDSPEKVLKRLYADNYPWLEGHILQNSGTQADARDVFQESITAAWINLQTGRFTGSNDQFNAYLRQICKYKWINELRSGNRKKLIHTDAFTDQHVPESGNPLEPEDAEQAKLLSKSFAALGDKCRTILSLYYYQKKSMASIAAHFDNTEKSIKNIKYRCMMQLRKLFLEQSQHHGGL